MKRSVASTGRVALPSAADDDGAAGCCSCMGGSPGVLPGRAASASSVAVDGEVADLGVALADAAGSVPRRQTCDPASGHSGGSVATGEDPGGLPGGAVGDVLAGGGTVTGEPSTIGATCWTAARAWRRRRSGSAGDVGTLRRASASRPSASPQSIPSTTARARWAGVLVAEPQAVERTGRIGPVGGALAFEVRHEDEAVGAGRGRQREAAKPSWSTPSSAAAASRTRAAFRVATSGRKRPVASAKPATARWRRPEPIGDTAHATPEVPIETTTSPAPAPSPSAAAALSPAAGAESGTVEAVRRPDSAGPSTRGTTSVAAERALEQVEAVLARGRGPVAGAAGVAAVGDELVEAGRAARAARSGSRAGGRPLRPGRRCRARARRASAAWSR